MPRIITFITTLCIRDGSVPWWHKFKVEMSEVEMEFDKLNGAPRIPSEDASDMRNVALKAFYAEGGNSWGIQIDVGRVSARRGSPNSKVFHAFRDIGGGPNMAGLWVAFQAYLTDCFPGEIIATEWVEVQWEGQRTQSSRGAVTWVTASEVKTVTTTEVKDQILDHYGVTRYAREPLITSEGLLDADRTPYKHNVILGILGAEPSAAILPEGYKAVAAWLDVYDSQVLPRICKTGLLLELVLAETEFLRACGWEEVGEDQWKEPPFLPAGTEHVPSAVRMLSQGHAINSELLRGEERLSHTSALRATFKKAHMDYLHASGWHTRAGAWVPPARYLTSRHFPHAKAAISYQKQMHREERFFEKGSQTKI